MTTSKVQIAIDIRMDGVDALAQAIQSLGYNVPHPRDFIMANASAMRLDNLGLVVPVPDEWYLEDQRARDEMRLPDGYEGL